MPRTRLLAAAILFGLAANAAQAQEFSNVIVFGDSLSDGGNYVGVIPNAQGSFTTNPDQVSVEWIADFYGIDLTPSGAANNGGWNFAWGGAQTNHPFCVGGDSGLPAPPCRSMTSQLAAYYARTGGAADPNALYSVWGGANDLFFNLALAQGGVITSAQVQANMITAATTELGIIASLQNAGANYIIVYNLPDVGRTPGFATNPATASISGLVLLYNGALNTGLAQLGDGIIPVDAYGLVNEVLANYQAYGFTNITGTACNLALTGGTSLFCSPGAYTTPTANQDYFFADGVHPSGAAHAMLAQAVIAEIAAPGQVSMLAEAALRAHSDHLDSMRTQAFLGRDDSRTNDTVRGYAALKFGNSDYEASGWSPRSDIRQATLTAGADFRINDSWRLGGAVSIANQQMDAGSSDVDGIAVNGSLYTVVDFSHGYLGAAASIGNDSFEIERHILLGTFDRIETGSTDASHVGFALSGGLVFGSDTFKHGPFADVTWTNVEVDGFLEESGDSTSMHFDGYDRDSLVGRLGYQLQASAGRVRPWARVAYNVENEDDQTFVRAGLNTMNGNFVMPGYTPSDNWVTAEVGIGFSISERSSMFVSYNGLFADDIQDHQAIAVGITTEFGSAAAPVEPEIVESSPDCSALDDDGDGVNNCNDQCPASAAGEMVGADGCPVPATEPEVVEEAKAFRG
jgi:outer membrane lipase/esterase